ncbi:MAG: hypothetical protein LBT19_02055 [Candidatus Nomurabacteria bacterium]|jgi:amino acid transporter|nr:hypothetical protein [Candidatus Nomurabacteria bacterium]
MNIGNNIPCAMPDGTIDPNCSDAGITSTIIIWTYVAIGLVAVIILIIAGIQYITSEGEPEKTKRAQATITYTVIGLIIATAAAAILSFVTGAFS